MPKDDDISARMVRCQQARGRGNRVTGQGWVVWVRDGKEVVFMSQKGVLLTDSHRGGEDWRACASRSGRRLARPSSRGTCQSLMGDSDGGWWRRGM